MKFNKLYNWKVVFQLLGFDRDRRDSSDFAAACNGNGIVAVVGFQINSFQH